MIITSSNGTTQVFAAKCSILFGGWLRVVRTSFSDIDITLATMLHNGVQVQSWSCQSISCWWRCL